MPLRHHRFIVRYLTLFGGEMTSKACVFLAFAYLARTFAPADFGAIELALSMATLLVLGVETGFGPYGARMVATAPERTAALVARIGLTRVLLGALAYGGMLATTRWYAAVSPGLVAIYGATLLLTAFNTQWVFQGLRQMQWVAAGNLLRYGSFAALVLLFVRSGADVRTVATAEVAGALALSAFNVVILVRRLHVFPDIDGVWRGAVALLRETWFLGASDLAWAVMWYAPILVLGAVGAGGVEQIAWLAAAVRIVIALHTFVWLYFFNMVPNLSKELHDGVAHWRALIDRSLSMSTWAGCLIALAGTLFAPVLLPLAYGPAYAAAAVPFQIAIWMIPVTWISGHFRFSLIVGGHQRLGFVASAISAVGTLAASAAGSWAAGASGAAVGLLAGGILNGAVAAAATFRAIGPVKVHAAAPALVACLVAAAISLGLRPLVGVTPAAMIACGGFVAASIRFLDVTGVQQALRRS